MKYFLDKPSWVIRCTRYRRPTMTFDLKLWPINLNINRHQIITKDYLYLIWRFWDNEFLSYPFRKVWDTNMTFDLDLMSWISPGTYIATRTIYLPLLKLLKQTVHRTSWFIFCIMLEYTGKLTYIHTGRHTSPPTKMCKVVCPPSSKEGKMMFQCLGGSFSLLQRN